MGGLYFFATPDTIDTQLPSEAFGPKPDHTSGSTTYNRFQVTDLHKTQSSKTTKAISVCKGQIRAVYNANDDSVTLIIKPAIDFKGLNVPKVKYFIYRGIEPGSIFNVNDPNKEVLPNGDPLSNDLTKFIRNDLKGQSSPVFGAISINAAYPEPLISSFNFDTDSTAALPHAPLIDGGKHIGNFKNGGFGFEIYLETLFPDDNSDYLLDAVKYIDVLSLGSTPTEVETLIHNTNKNQVLRFMDPSAFYGNLASGDYHFIDSSNSKTKSTVTSTYEDVLGGGMTGGPSFLNLNTVYFDLRNELNEPFNFYDIYSDNIEFKVDQGSFSSVDFYRSGWPLLALSISGSGDFPANISNDIYSLHLSLPFSGTENSKPLCFISIGRLLKAPFAKKKEYSRQFESLQARLSNTNFCESLELAFDNVPNASNDALPLASFSRVFYIKQTVECPAVPSSGKVFRPIESCDNVFLPLELSSTYLETEMDSYANGVQIYREEQWIDCFQKNGQAFMGEIGVSVVNSDVGVGQNMVVFAIPRTKFNSNLKAKTKELQLTTKTNSYVNESDPETKVQDALEYLANELDLKVDTVTLMDDQTPVEVKKLRNRSANGSSSKVNPSDVAFFEISRSQLDQAIDDANNDVNGTFIPGTPVRLGIKYENGKVDYVTKGGPHFYVEYTLCLRGVREELDSGGIGTGNVEIIEYEIGKQYLAKERPDIYNNPPKYKGDGYKVTEILDPITQVNSHDFVEPNGEISNNCKKYKLECTVFMHRGWNLSSAQFCSFKDFVKSNTEAVWSSVSNKGLGAYFIPEDLNQTAAGKGEFVRQNIVECVINVEYATAEKLKEVGDGEILIIAEMGAYLSYIDSHNRRSGMFYFLDNNYIDVNGTKEYVDEGSHIAHEFGHVFGLEDRYAFGAEITAFMKYNGGTIPFTAQNTPEVVRVDDEAKWDKCAYYLGAAHPDDIYRYGFNWMHNLMSNTESPVAEFVPYSSGEENYEENNKTYESFMEYLRPGIQIHPVKRIYDKFCHFVTPYQLQLVLDPSSAGDEDDNPYVIHFREFDPNGKLPTFCGPDVINSEDVCISDAGFNFGLTDADLRNNFNDNLHRMEKRKLDDPTATPTTLNDTYKAFFMPYEKNPVFSLSRRKLDYIDIYSIGEEMELTEAPITSYGDIRYDIALGGNAYQDHGLPGPLAVFATSGYGYFPAWKVRYRSWKINAAKIFITHCARVIEFFWQVQGQNVDQFNDNIILKSVNLDQTHSTFQYTNQMAAIEANNKNLFDLLGFMYVAEGAAFQDQYSQGRKFDFLNDNDEYSQVGRSSNTARVFFAGTSEEMTINGRDIWNQSYKNEEMELKEWMGYNNPVGNNGVEMTKGLMRHTPHVSNDGDIINDTDLRAWGNHRYNVNDTDGLTHVLNYNVYLNRFRIIDIMNGARNEA